MRHTRPTITQLQRIAESKRVPCRPRSTGRGCGVPAGEQCVNLAPGPNYGEPLGGLGAHVDRLVDAHAAESGSRTRDPIPA